MIKNELKLQIQTINFFESIKSLNLLKQDAELLSYAVLNDGKDKHANMIRGSLLKRAGRKKGVPDLLMLINDKRIWIELKDIKFKNRKNGGLSEDQIEFIDREEKRGVKTYVVYSLDDFEHTLRAINLITQ